ncbi:cell envelope integrity protein CreD [Sedimentisphaera salicampi]|uniref:Inner membrane protein CreD n=1 Tax=Sedimentisphaera salicampi TaxID=1941349 RepID=A0A1W6LMA7_9BACT|nr:cell envelope integrity protein CreD [Sedimentisphaera salicampi]ARN56873.1 Inner membrane protein CreD [Sedimentisphaera salicampi]OXU15043.1 Inner membrane protein CreD [Sedimentisphaera salicampi]
MKKTNVPSAWNTTYSIIKFAAIIITLLLFLIPLGMFDGIMRSRRSRCEEVKREISEKWSGGAQTITGPVIILPYQEREIVPKYDKTGTETGSTVKTANGKIAVLPETLNIQAGADAHVRYRSIYEAVVYNSQISISGRFVLPEADQLKISEENVTVGKPELALFVNSTKSFSENVKAEINGNSKVLRRGATQIKTFPQGDLYCFINQKLGDEVQFNIDLNVKGAGSLSFAPLGNETSVELESSWPNPSFTGQFLPKSRKISDSGFSAEWQVLGLNREYPQIWNNRDYRIGESFFGVEFFNSLNVYHKYERTAKYAILFVIFTFIAMFLIESACDFSFQYFHYLLVGAASTLFYIILLATSEHLSYAPAFLISAAAMTILNSAYCWAISKKGKAALSMFITLGLLYGFWYLVLNLQDTALLVCSWGLFIILAAIMFITRKSRIF